MDKRGRQKYLMIRAGAESLYLGGDPLPLEDILQFILDLPPEPIYFWFGGNYDATMILRDLPKNRIENLLTMPGFTFWRRFGIEWHPKHFLSVCLVGNDQKIVKGSVRTINEVYGFFQSSFITALRGFEIGTKEQLDRLAVNKAARSDFIVITQEIDEYNALECELGALLMERLRKLCFDARIFPNSWRGAGAIATALHRQYATPKRALCAIPDEVDALAKEAYYGGRFEISVHGTIDRPVFEYDIRSAYPAAMSALPCLIHGRWHSLQRAPRRTSDPYLARVRFANPLSPWCRLPVRTEDGYLMFPTKGGGVYWSWELEKFIGKLDWIEGWRYESRCSCRPFAWVKSLYDYRKTLSKMQGYPIKLGINALYGKLAQRNPVEGPWTNYVWAGMITSITRARLLEAINGHEDDIIMCATDGIYSLRRLPNLRVSSELGDWEFSEYHDGLFIAQPGVYWSPDERKVKTRGISQREFEKARASLERQFARWDGAGDAPMVTFPTVRFRGLKAAHAQHNHAGVWHVGERELRMDYSIKRASVYRDGTLMRSLPHDDFFVSCAHDSLPQKDDDDDEG